MTRIELSPLLDEAPSPSYVIDLARLESNLRRLQKVRERTGARVLLALKGYATFSTFDLCAQYLDGTTASSLDEARLGAEEFGGEVHAYAPAWTVDDVPELASLCSHVTFNSFGQARFLRQRLTEAAGDRDLSFGIRVNPEHSEVSTPIYDPCARFSRLGVTAARFEPDSLEGISGLHFHACCGQGADVLDRAVASFEKRFGEWIRSFTWVNFGGGQRISAPDYDLDLLCSVIGRVRDRYGVDVYLEPGEAVGYDAGVFVTTVLDVIENEKRIAIVDSSAAAHLPDVLEMPYRPELVGAGRQGERAHDYVLGGLTCLAGDVIGEYSFDRPLSVGDRLVFLDMAHYTMVKNNTFNGVRLPSIVLADTRSQELRVVRRFGYEDYRGRLS